MSADEWRATTPDVIARYIDAPWVLGDWAIEAEHHDLIDERTHAIKHEPRFDGGELAEHAFVAERFPPDRRRRVPWSYHYACAKLPPDAADEILQTAVDDQLTLQEVRAMAQAVARQLKDQK